MLQDEFELLFREFDHEANFLYMKSFRRARIVFDFPRSATRARICLHQITFRGSTIKCYFAQVNGFLMLFLFSVYFGVKEEILV